MSNPIFAKVKLTKWHILDRTSVEFEGMVCRPVIVAEYHINGQRQLHCIFRTPEDTWQPVAMSDGAVLRLVDSEFTAALAAMDFQFSNETGN